MLQGHCVQHVFRQVQVCEKSENLDLEPSVGSFGPPGNAGSSPLGPDCDFPLYGAKHSLPGSWMPDLGGKKSKVSEVGKDSRNLHFEGR